jgi:hypothetical protein
MIIFRFSVKTLKKICFCLFEGLKSIKILSLQFKENQVLNQIDDMYFNTHTKKKKTVGHPTRNLCFFFSR